MNKKTILLLAIVLLFANTSIADTQKDEMYYKRQIQNQRILYGTNGFIRATKLGKIDIVECFAKAGFNMNETFCGMPISFETIYLKQPEALNIMLKYGANPNAVAPPCAVDAKRISLIQYAVKHKDSTSVKYLIKAGANVNDATNGETVLNYAIKKKQTEIAEILINAGAKIDEKTLKLVEKSKDEYLKDLVKNSSHSKKS